MDVLLTFCNYLSLKKAFSANIQWTNLFYGQYFIHWSFNYVCFKIYVQSLDLAYVLINGVLSQGKGQWDETIRKLLGLSPLQDKSVIWSNYLHTMPSMHGKELHVEIAAIENYLF